MQFRISNRELLKFIHDRGNLKDKSIMINSKFTHLAETFKQEHCLKGNVTTLKLTLKQVYEVKSKDEEWMQKIRSFEVEQAEPSPKRVCHMVGAVGRPSVIIKDCPSKRSEKKILREGLESISTMANEQGITKEEMFVRLFDEACKLSDWDMSECLSQLHYSSPTIPINDLVTLTYIGNLSQRQYQMCRNLLVRYDVQSFRPRNEIDSYKTSLYPTVKVDNLNASVKVDELFDSTFHAIFSCESLDEKLSNVTSNATLLFKVKAGLDGSGSHKRRHQLSGDPDDDAITCSSEHFLGVFMTPMAIEIQDGDVNSIVWENPYSNSIFYTRPIQLTKMKESRELVEKIFPDIQSCIDSLASPHLIEGIACKVAVETKITMIDGKMVDVVLGDSGAFCHYCDISQSNASSLDHLAATGVGGMLITKTIEECQRRWELLESGKMAYRDPERAGQCHKPLLSQSGRLFAILHQELRSLDFALKILYHLVSSQEVWSEANPTVKAKVAEAKLLVIKHIKATCGGLLVDSPTSAGGNTNTGPVAKRFFSPNNREAICSLIDGDANRINYNVFLGQMNVCLAVSENADTSKTVDVKAFQKHCFDTMIHIALHFPWVRVSPSVHQMLAHNWELFEMMNGSPIARWSESGLEAWNKHIRNFRSGAGCRARQNSVKNNIQDIFVRMLITSAPAIANARQHLLRKERKKTVVFSAASQEESMINSMYI